MSGEERAAETGERRSPDMQLVLYQDGGRTTVTLCIWRLVRLCSLLEEEDSNWLRL